jgi:RNase E specificity factor CsrD
MFVMESLKNWLTSRPLALSAPLLLMLVNGGLAIILMLAVQVLPVALNIVLTVAIPAAVLLSLISVLLLHWLHQQTMRQQEHQQILTQLTERVNDLLQDAYLPVSRDSSLPDRLTLLRQTLQHQVRREQEIRQLVRVQGLVDHELAIGNRIYFESKLQHYLLDPAEPQSGVLFLIQLSHPEFSVGPNDAIQRLAGSADLIQQLVNHQPVSVLARVADADLALLIPGMEQKDAEQLGDRLAMVLSRASFFAGYEDFDLVHLGYVIYQRGQTGYQVMSEADMALKTAQLQGPNAAYGFYPEQKPKIKGSVWWRTELGNALRENRFLLSFQPVFSWQQHDIIQHEVLVRLQTSDHDKLAAAVFLPMAVNCGLTAQLDQYVLTKAARLCQAEQKNGVRCSVNLTAESLLNSEFMQWLQQSVQDGLLVAAQIALEIDEYHLIRQYQKLRPRLLRLQQQGFSLIIDHVGLNISPCDYLTELPVDAVKLHTSVVRNIDSQLEQQLFIRGLVASHQARGVKVIATGVESQAEWQVLQKLGVSGAQGFYFSQPLAELMPQAQLS